MNIVYCIWRELLSFSKWCDFFSVDEMCNNDTVCCLFFFFFFSLVKSQKSSNTYSIFDNKNDLQCKLFTEQIFELVSQPATPNAKILIFTNEIKSHMCVTRRRYRQARESRSVECLMFGARLYLVCVAFSLFDFLFHFFIGDQITYTSKNNSERIDNNRKTVCDRKHDKTKNSIIFIDLIDWLISNTKKGLQLATHNTTYNV